MAAEAVSPGSTEPSASVSSMAEAVICRFPWRAPKSTPVADVEVMVTVAEPLAGLVAAKPVGIAYVTVYSPTVRPVRV